MRCRAAPAGTLRAAHFGMSTGHSGKIMKKALKITGIILRGILIFLVSAIIILLVVRLIGKAINEKTPDGGINESMFVDINGTRQWINIYGQDKDNPVLL